jgi:hypothetical protein
MASEDWKSIDIDTLSVDERFAWDQLKASYRQHKTNQAVFQALFSKRAEGKLPAGMELKFGYRYGKLSVAIGEAREAAPKKAAAKPQSLGDWLEERVHNS